jgi:beta-xylosidase
MARSKSIWGPYEPSPLNPILSAAGTNEYVQATGHCEAFEDKNGEWWGVCLGIRQGAEGLWGLGRETFLTRGHWNENGWLKFDRAKIALDGFENLKEEARLTAAPGTDLLYIHDPELSHYTIDDGGITLSPSLHDITSPERPPTFVGKRQRRLKGTSSVALSHNGPNTSTSSLVASLVVYKDEHRWLRISYSFSTHAVKLQVFNKAKGIDRTVKQEIRSEFQKLGFVLAYTEMEYTVSFAADGGELRKLGTVETMELSDKDFVGPIIGVHAVSESAPKDEVEVRFKDFVVDSV